MTTLEKLEDLNIWRKALEKSYHENLSHAIGNDKHVEEVHRDYEHDIEMLKIRVEMLKIEVLMSKKLFGVF